MAPLQPQPGVFNEDGFLGLDLAIAEAGKRGLRVMLTLSDYWSYYGGFHTYTQWAQQYANANVSSVDEVYSCKICLRWMKDYMSHLLHRVNRFTGQPYHADPRVFAFELVNEPRNNNNKDGSRVYDWLVELASHFRSIDTTHLLTVGLDGFFSHSTPELQQYNPYNGAQLHGVDFLHVAKIDQLDFISIHAHVDEWCVLCILNCPKLTQAFCSDTQLSWRQTQAHKRREQRE